MSNLANVLELLHDADTRLGTLRAVGREWRHTAHSQQAFEAYFSAIEANSPPGSVSRLTGYGAAADAAIPDEMETYWRLWTGGDGRKRAEFSVGDDDVAIVFDGPTWWSVSSRAGARTNGGRVNSQHVSGPAQVLLETTAVLAALRLEFLGEHQVAGRAAFSVRGRPRASNPFSLHALSSLGLGADEYQLFVDAERGVMLRCEARLRAQPFMVTEMTEVAFDADLPAELFTLRAPPGESFDDVSQHQANWKRGRGLSLRSRPRGR